MDASNLLRLFHELNTSPDYAEWRQQATKWLKRNGPDDFDGNFSYDAWVSLGSDKQAGIMQRIKLAKNNKRKEDQNAANKELDEFWEYQLKAQSIDIVSAYEQARQHWESIVTDAEATLSEKWAANDAYGKKLTNFIKQAESEAGFNLTFEGDNVLIGRLTAERTALTGEDPNAETLSYQTERGKKTKAAEFDETEDARSTAEGVRDLGTALSSLYERDERGRPTHYMAMLDGEGNLTEKGIWAAVPVSMFSGKDRAVVQVEDPPAINDANGVPIPTRPIVTAHVGVPIYGAQYPVDARGMRVGKDLSPAPGTNNYLGARFRMTDGTYIFKWQADDGQFRYSYTNPFQGTDGGDATLTPQKDGLTLNTGVPWDPTIENNPPAYDKAKNMKPAYGSADTADDMPNTVFHSTYAAWLKTPGAFDRGQVRKDSTADIVAILQDEADGNIAQMGAAAREIDEMRAAAIGTSPDDEWRLIRANSRGGANTLATEQYRRLVAGGGTYRPGEEPGLTLEEKRARDIFNKDLEDIFGPTSKSPWAFELRSRNAAVPRPAGQTRILGGKFDMKPINTAGLAEGVFQNITGAINKYADDYNRPSGAERARTPVVPQSVLPQVLQPRVPTAAPVSQVQPRRPAAPKPPKPPEPPKSRIYEPPPPPPKFSEPYKPPSPSGSPIRL